MHRICISRTFCRRSNNSSSTSPRNPRPASPRRQSARSAQPNRCSGDFGGRGVDSIQFFLRIGKVGFYAAGKRNAEGFLRQANAPFFHWPVRLIYFWSCQGRLPCFVLRLRKRSFVPRHPARCRSRQGRVSGPPYRHGHRRSGLHAPAPRQGTSPE